MAKKAKEKEEEEQFGLVFIGDNGRHLSGIPARDLSADEVAKLTTKELDAILGTGLYKINGGNHG